MVVERRGECRVSFLGVGKAVKNRVFANVNNF